MGEWIPLRLLRLLEHLAVLIKAEYLLCGSCIQPKKQFKVLIIGILKEKDSFY